MTAKVSDKLAETLEASGFWRRAAVRWLDVMQSHALSDTQRDWVRQRRYYCLSCVKPVAPEEKLDLSAIARAANATQERMGISLPDGGAFRGESRRPKVRGRVLSPTDDAVSQASGGMVAETLSHTYGIDINHGDFHTEPAEY